MKTQITLEWADLVMCQPFDLGNNYKFLAVGGKRILLESRSSLDEDGRGYVISTCVLGCDLQAYVHACLERMVECFGQDRPLYSVREVVTLMHSMAPPKLLEAMGAWKWLRSDKGWIPLRSGPQAFRASGKACPIVNYEI